MKKILLLLSIPTSLSAQSFSDYKDWVLNHPDFFVKSMVTDTLMSIHEDSTYPCHIFESKDGWIFNVTNEKGKSLPFKERDLIYFKKYFIRKD